MNNCLAAIKNFVALHKRTFIISTGAILVVALLVFVALLFVYNMPKDNYQAVDACKLLTPAKAQDLLGDNVISVDSNAPVISDNTSTSKCSYTDRNPDKDKMMIAAIAVRAGLNKKGVQQNKADFKAKKPTNGIKTVKNLGDSAYFNEDLGQLNVLRGREWFILNYGVASAPQFNTLDNAVELAKKVLN